MTLTGRTILVSGGSRGIGLAIAVRAARDGARVALLAKTDEPHPRLPGTIHTAAAEIEAAGGRALAIVGDVRREEDVVAAVERTVSEFGGIDACVNNASAIDLSGPEDLPMKRYDLMQDVNSRGTFLLTRECLPHLRRSDNPHVLTLSPPLSTDPRWMGPHPAYTLSKYGMTIITLGIAQRYAEDGVAANCLWPRTIIATAAVQNLLGGDESMRRARTPEIMGDAAHAILTRPAGELTGRTLIDEEVLAWDGVTDLSGYTSGDPGELQLDLFVEA